MADRPAWDARSQAFARQPVHQPTMPYVPTCSPPQARHDCEQAQRRGVELASYFI